MLSQVIEINKNSPDLILNPGSERNLISICLKNPDKIIDVEDAEIHAEHFGVRGHKYIFMAIQYLYSKKIIPTSLAINEVLADKTAKESIEELGGLEYLTLLEENMVRDTNLPIYIAKIKQSYTRRSLISICDNVKDFIVSDNAETLNPTELISKIETPVADLSINTSNSNEVYKMGDETEEILLLRSENPDTVPGLETGWVQVDRATNGFLPGDLTVVCAESKTGKSVLLTNWATKLAIHDKIPILYIDTEMSAREQEDRILSILSNIPQNEIVSGMYMMDTVHGTSKEKIEKLNIARRMLKDGAYYHIYMPQFTIEKVTAITRKFQLQHNIGAMFFDYIKIPSSQTGSFKNLQEYQSLGFFTSGLKDIAGTLGMPVFSAAQTNRSNLGEQRKDASAIGGSYRILQLASKLMFLTNKSDEDIAKQGIVNGNQVLQIAYQRNGESNCDPINIFFNKPILKQMEV